MRKFFLSLTFIIGFVTFPVGINWYVKHGELIPFFWLGLYQVIAFFYLLRNKEWPN